MSSFCKCKSYSHFFGKNFSIYAIFNDQSFNDALTNGIVSFEQLGPGRVSAIFNKGDNLCGFMFSVMHTKLLSGKGSTLKRKKLLQRRGKTKGTDLSPQKVYL